MKKDNVEALKSSALTGVACGATVGGALFTADNPHYLCAGALAFVVGLCAGLLVTWYPDEE